MNKQRWIIQGENNENNTKDIEIAVPLKYLNEFWRTLEVSLTLINCKINFIFTWSEDYVIKNSTATKIRNVNLFFVTLSTQ